MKKGFTLIELLAVLVVIGIVSAITMVSMNRIIKANKENAYKTQVSFIEKKAKEWSISHNAEVLSKLENGTYMVYLETLINDGYIDNDKLIDPITGEEMVGCVRISYNDELDEYNYKYDSKFCSRKVVVYYDNNTHSTYSTINASGDAMVSLNDELLTKISSATNIRCKNASVKMNLNGSVFSKINIKVLEDNAECRFYNDLSDLTIPTDGKYYVLLLANSSLNAFLDIANNSNIVLDMGGNTLTMTGKTITNYGKLEILGGGLDLNLIKNYNELNIHDAIVTATSSAVISYGGKVNIYGTTYISSTATAWAPVLRIRDGALVTINSNNSPSCTSASTDTLNGVCIYAQGDGTTSNGNIAVYIEEGNLYINKGTYYGLQTSIYHKGSGQTNILNAHVISGYKTIFNSGTGNVNICNTRVIGPNKDLKIMSTGVINYDSNVMFNANTNIPVVEGDSSLAVPGYTGDCLKK